jgi:formamidopyrimidine-DNA glycosylase
MPELPEMENYRRLLNERIANQIITDVQVNREKSINLNPNLFIKTVRNQKVINVERRAKHLLFHLQKGHVLLLHLMLGGLMFYGLESEKPKRTIQVQLNFGEQHLFFIGLRLGYLHFHSEIEVEQILSHLGPEPLSADFTLEEFSSLIHQKHGRLKTALIDQDFISGIGNCYSDEICYHSQIMPTRNIKDLSEPEIHSLYQSMKNVLLDALKHGGYLKNPFYLGDTLTGSYDEMCKVYDREGESCQRCGAAIVKEMISSRKTFYCPNCQH